jgi:hypothetical protein
MKSGPLCKQNVTRCHLRWYVSKHAAEFTHFWSSIDLIYCTSCILYSWSLRQNVMNQDFLNVHLPNCLSHKYLSAVVLGLPNDLLFKIVSVSKNFCTHELLFLLETASLILTDLPFYTCFHTWTPNVLPPVEMPSLTTYHTSSKAYAVVQNKVMANGATVLSIIKLDMFHYSLLTFAMFYSVQVTKYVFFNSLSFFWDSLHYTIVISKERRSCCHLQTTS